MARIMFLLVALVAGAAIAATPQEASFRVETQQGGGSGTAIHKRIIVTNSHVVGHRLRTDITVKSDWSGQTMKAEGVCISPEYDICLLWTEKDVPYTEMADEPKAGDIVKLYGYGPYRKLRSGDGKVIGVSDRKPNGAENIETWVQSLSGDSGGGLFDANGKLVAVNWGGDLRTNSSVSVPAKYVKKIGDEWVREMIHQSRWSEFQCFGGGCAGGSCGQGGMMQNAGGGRGKAPPKFPVQRPQDDQGFMPPSQPPQQVQQPPPKPIDTDKLVAEIVEKLASDPRIKGMPGKDGMDGKNGIDGKDGKNGIDGRDGKNGTDGKDGIDGKPGIVAVVDYDVLASEVIRRMPPITMKSYDRNGKLIDSENYPIGTPIKIQYDVVPQQASH